jgi:hypothetical protein
MIMYNAIKEKSNIIGLPLVSHDMRFLKGDRKGSVNRTSIS